MIFTIRPANRAFTGQKEWLHRGGHSLRCVVSANELVGVLLLVSGRLWAELLARASLVFGRLVLRLVVVVGDGGVERPFLGFAVSGTVARTITG